MQIWRLHFHLWEKQAGHLIAQGWMKKKTKGLSSGQDCSLIWLILMVLLVHGLQWGKVMEFSGAELSWWEDGRRYPYLPSMMLLENEVSLDSTLTSFSQINQILLCVAPHPSSSSLFVDSRLLLLYQKRIKPIKTKAHNLFLLKEYLQYLHWLVS